MHLSLTWCLLSLSVVFLVLAVAGGQNDIQPANHLRASDVAASDDPNETAQAPTTGPTLVGAQSYEPPFKIAQFLPVVSESCGNLTTCKTSISGSTPLVVAFNLPVIALGEDVLQASPNDALLVKASNSRGTVAGRGYWTSPSVYRFDPEPSWPTDLTLEVSLRDSLRSASGQSLAPLSPEDEFSNDSTEPKFPIFFQTPTLKIERMTVSSQHLTNLTDGAWSSTFASSGGSDPVDNCHEVPEDGEIELSFSAEIDQSALPCHGRPCTAGDHSADTFFKLVDVTASKEVAEWAGLPDMPMSTTKCGRVGETLADGAVRCVKVKPIGPLITGKVYTIVLKEGHQYSSISGAIQKLISSTPGKKRVAGVPPSLPVQPPPSVPSSPMRPVSHHTCLTGLRPFKFSGARGTRPVKMVYKRLDFYLNHGISSNTSAESLASQITVKGKDADNSDAFRCVGRLTDKSTFQLECNDLIPTHQYDLLVKGSEAVKDGTNLPLQTSEISFIYDYVPPATAFPQWNLPVSVLRLQASKPSGSQKLEPSDDAAEVADKVAAGHDSASSSDISSPTLLVTDEDKDAAMLVYPILIKAPGASHAPVGPKPSVESSPVPPQEFNVTLTPIAAPSFGLSAIKAPRGSLSFPEALSYIYAGSSYRTIEIPAIDASQIPAVVGEGGQSKYPLSKGVIWKTNGKEEPNTMNVLEIPISKGSGAFFVEVGRSDFDPRYAHRSYTPTISRQYLEISVPYVISYVTTNEGRAKLRIDATLFPISGQFNSAGRKTDASQPRSAATAAATSTVPGAMWSIWQVDVDDSDLLTFKRDVADDDESQPVRPLTSLWNWEVHDGVGSLMVNMTAFIELERDRVKQRRKSEGQKAEQDTWSSYPSYSAPQWIIVAEMPDGSFAVADPITPDIGPHDVFPDLYGGDDAALVESALDLPVKLTGGVVRIARKDLYGVWTPDRNVVAPGSKFAVTGSIVVNTAGSSDKVAPQDMKPVTAVVPSGVSVFAAILVDAADPYNRYRLGNHGLIRAGQGKDSPAIVIPRCVHVVSELGVAGAYSAEIAIPRNFRPGAVSVTLSSIFLEHSELNYADLKKRLATIAAQLSHPPARPGQATTCFTEAFGAAVTRAFGNSSFVGVLEPRTADQLGSGSVLVADPRPPTLELRLDSMMPTVGKEEAISIKGDIKSYTSRPVQSLRVEVLLTLPVELDEARSNGTSQELPNMDLKEVMSDIEGLESAMYVAEEHGIIAKAVLITDRSGGFAKEISMSPIVSKLSATPLKVTPGGRISLELSATGLTGEVLSKEATLHFSESEFYLRSPSIASYRNIVPDELARLETVIERYGERGSPFKVDQSLFTIYQVKETKRPKGYNNRDRAEGLCSKFFADDGSSPNTDTAEFKAVLAPIRVCTPKLEGNSLSCFSQFISGSHLVVATATIASIDLPKKLRVIKACSEKAVTPTNCAGRGTVLDLPYNSTATESKGEVSVRLINPFIGILDGELAPPSASLLYVWGHSIGRGSCGNASGVVNVPFKNTFAIGYQRMMDTTDIEKKIQLSALIPAPSQGCCAKGRCDLAVILSVVPTQPDSTEDATEGASPTGLNATYLPVVRTKFNPLFSMGTVSFVSSDLTAEENRPDALAALLRLNVTVQFPELDEEETSKDDSGGPPVLLPGAHLKVNLEATPSTPLLEGEDIADVEAEAILVVVDKAFRDLRPVDSTFEDFSQFLAHQMQTSEDTATSAISAQPYVTLVGSLEAYYRVYNIIRRRIEKEYAMTIPNWPTLLDGRHWYQGDLDQSDEVFFQALSSFVTLRARYGWDYGEVLQSTSRASMGFELYSPISMDSGASGVDGIVARSSPMLRARAKSSPGPPASQDSTSGDVSLRVEGDPLAVVLRVPMVRSEVESPNAAGQMVQSYRLTAEGIDIVVPDRTTTYVIKSYVAAAGASRDDTVVVRSLQSALGNEALKAMGSKHGSAEYRWGVADKLFASARPLYVQPYVPRILRQHDVVDFGVVLSSEKITSRRQVVVEMIFKKAGFLQLHPGLQSKQTITLESSTEPSTRSVLWRAASTGLLGSVGLEFTLRDQATGRALDRVASNIAVKPFMPMITVGTATFFPSPRSDDEMPRPVPLLLPPINKWSEGALTVNLAVGFGGVLESLLTDRLRSDFPASILTDEALADAAKAPMSVKHSISADSILLALRGAFGLASRRGGDIYVKGIVGKAAQLSGALLSEFLVPQSARQSNSDYTTNPYGFLRLPWRQLEPLVNGKLPPPPPYLPPCRINFSLTSRAIHTLTEITRLMAIPSFSKAAKAVLPTSLTNASFLTNISTWAAALETDLKAAMECEFERYIAVADKQQTELDSSTETLVSEPSANTFLSYFGVERWSQIRQSVDANLLNNFEGSGDKPLQDDKAVKLMTDESDKCILSAASAKVAVVFLNDDKSPSRLKAFASSCSLAAQQATRVQGRTAYIANAAGSAYPLPDDVQAAVLQLWSLEWYRTGDISTPPRSATFVYQLALYMAQGGASKYSPFLFTGLSPTNLIVTLRALDVFDLVSNPGVFVFSAERSAVRLHATAALKIANEDTATTLLNSTFDSNHLTPISSSRNWTTLFEGDKLDSAVSTVLTFNVKGSGASAASITASFTPEAQQAPPAYKGILVEKVYQPLNEATQSCMGSPKVLFAHPGNVLCVTISLTVKDQLTDVVIQDMTPAGLELIDEALSRSPSNPYPAPRNSLGNFLLPKLCGNPEIRSSEGTVRWTCRALQPGTFHLSYKVTANLPGAYSVSPSQAFQERNPDVMGTSGGAVNSFVVMDGISSLEEGLKLLGIRTAPPQDLLSSARRACGHCSFGSTCNPTTGACEKIIFAIA